MNVRPLISHQQSVFVRETNVGRNICLDSPRSLVLQGVKWTPPLEKVLFRLHLKQLELLLLFVRISHECFDHAHAITDLQLVLDSHSL